MQRGKIQLGATLALVLMAQGCTLAIPAGLLANGTALFNANANLVTAKPPTTPKPDKPEKPVVDDDDMDGEEEEETPDKPKPRPEPGEPQPYPIDYPPPPRPKPEPYPYPMPRPIEPQPYPYPIDGPLPSDCESHGKADTNRDGAVSLPEFAAYERIARKWLADEENTKLLAEDFAGLDGDGNKKLSPEEYCQATMTEPDPSEESEEVSGNWLQGYGNPDLDPCMSGYDFFTFEQSGERIHMSKYTHYSPMAGAPLYTTFESVSGTRFGDKLVLDGTAGKSSPTNKFAAEKVHYELFYDGQLRGSRNGLPIVFSRQDALCDDNGAGVIANNDGGIVAGGGGNIFAAGGGR